MTPFSRWSDLQRYLDGLDPFRIRLGLGPTRRALQRLGNPHRRLRVFHVAGTNGKGSTCALLFSMLRAAGYRVGLYTSPHFLDVRERIRVDGTMIARPAFSRAAAQVAASLRRSPRFELTHFEFLTVVAFLHFDLEEVDFAVVETGMGGRLDATNVVQPCVSVLTPIGKDHTEWLGCTLDAIATEKAMIIKPGAPAVAAESRPAFWRRARECGANLTVPKFKSRASAGTGFEYRGRRLPLSLEGRCFASNAALALAALEAAEVHLPWESIRKGLVQCRWPGRGEWIRRQRRTWLLDVAHNPHAMVALREVFQRRFPRTAPVVVLSLLRTKDAGGILSALQSWCGPMVLTRAAGAGRSHDPHELAARSARLAMKVTIESDSFRALDRAGQIAGPNGPIIVTGSHTMVAGAYRYFQMPAPPSV